MCGLIGAAGQLTVKHERAIKTLLILDSLRGIDSTGLAAIARNGDLKMAKSVGDPFCLFNTKSYDKAMSGVNSVFIGHNRFATQGKVIHANAHPFAFPTLVGAHNGTLKNKYVLDDNKLYDVDSENLYHHMDRNGVENTIHKLDGAWALTWFNHEESTLNFIRNEERPLHVTVAEEDGVLFWASESWMLRIALSREGIKFSNIDEIDENVWHKIEVFKDGKLGKPHLTPLSTKVVPYVYNNVAKWDNIHKPTVPNKPKVTQQAANQTVAQSHGIMPLNVYKKDDVLTVEIVGEGVDKSGAHFYMCRDRKHEDQNIRLYKNRNDTVSLMNKFITCTLHSFRFADFFGEYHKVEHGSVKLVTPSTVTALAIVDKKESPTEGKSFQDCKGKLIPYKDWMQKHGTCAMCEAAVDPSESFRFTPQGDALCHICVADPLTKQYCNFN